MSLLVLAPHLEYPVRSGADIAIDRKYSQFSRWLPYVTIVAKDQVVTYREGSVAEIRPFKNTGRSSVNAAIRTLLAGSHYHLEKFLTPAFVTEARTHLCQSHYSMIVFSYLCTCELLKHARPDATCFVETHNDDFLWFEQLEANTRNPLGKRVARLSERWTRRFLESAPGNLVFVHVSEADRVGYQKVMPGHKNLVIPIGVDTEFDRTECPETEDSTIRLLFVGSLNVNMNLDALVYFRDTFLPELKNRIPTGLKIMVAGRTPSAAVIELCQKESWSLFPDLTEEDLNQVFCKATFSLLPFAYSTGAKLKLLKTLSRGVPFLATPQAFTQVEKNLPACLVSDNPSDWAEHVLKTQSEGISQKSRDKLQEHAASFSWDSVAKQVYEGMVTFL